LSLVFRTFATLVSGVSFFFPRKIKPKVEIRKTSRDFGSTDLRFFYRLTEEA